MSNPKKIEPVETAEVRLLQITDCHIFATAEACLLGLNTRESFNAVAQAAVKNSGDPDLLLVTGDLSQDASPASYQFLARRLDEIGIPTFWLPGNHDDSEVLRACFTGNQIHAETRILVGPWQIIMLDSTLKGEVHGRVSESQLGFLETALNQYPDRHALVCLHHQALDTGSEWLDHKGLRDSQLLRNRLALHDNVRGVLWGHVHQESQQTIDGVEWMSTPSSCIQFKPGSKEFALDSEAPGYRQLNLKSDGRIETSVYRVKDLDFDVDFSRRGY